MVVDSGGKKMTATTQIQFGGGDVIKFIIEKATAPAAERAVHFYRQVDIGSVGQPDGVDRRWRAKR